MAIELVGTPQAGAAVSSGDVTLTFDGIPSEDDLSILIGGNRGTEEVSDVGPNPDFSPGYTQGALERTSVLSTGVWYKFMGATPDTNVVGLGSSGNEPEKKATAYVSIMLRGVALTSPIVAIIGTGGVSGENPDWASVTTVNNGAWVIAGAGAAGSDDEVGELPNYDNSTQAAIQDTQSMGAGLATTITDPKGTEDPPAWVGPTPSTTWTVAHYVAFTIEIRPSTVIAIPEGFGSSMGVADPSAAGHSLPKASGSSLVIASTSAVGVGAPVPVASAPQSLAAVFRRSIVRRRRGFQRPPSWR